VLSVILIRNTRTQHFFGNGVWTADWTEAQNYPDIKSATAACARYHLKDTELVAQFELETEDYDTGSPVERA